MPVAIGWIAVGASLTACAIALATVRLLSLTSARAVLLLATRWNRLPGPVAASAVAAVGVLAAVSFAQFDPGAQVENSVQSAKWPLSGLPGAQCRADVAAAGGCDPALKNLTDYAAQLDGGQPADDDLGAPQAPENTSAGLPDVNTMIARLVKRLESETGDAKGWRTLGWSYANTGQYQLASKAYETALALDPDNAELKSDAAAARASAASGGTAESSKPPAGADGIEKTPAPQPQAENATPDAVQPDMIRAMVDKLAARLKTSPQDADGWVKLMRSRTVLGEKDLAQEALRKGLAAFASDKPLQDQLAEAAKEFGLSAE